MDCSYHQRVVSVHAEGAEETAAASAASASAAPAPPSTARREWVELGEVRQRLVCTLDVNDLRRKKERSERLDDDRDGSSDMQDVKVKEEYQQQQQCNRHRQKSTSFVYALTGSCCPSRWQ